jgi:hypothetical protein
MRRIALPMTALVALASCAQILGVNDVTAGDGGVATGSTELRYGAGHPGVALPEGGELRHDNVRMSGMPEQTWVMVYQYTGPTLAQTAPFATPADGGKGPFGNCVDERNGAPTWPVAPITGATYLTLLKRQLTGPGITGALDIIKTKPANTVDNSTFRKYGFTYGGGVPGDREGFNAGMTTAAMSTPGGSYTLDIGKGTPMPYYLPERFTAPLGIGGATTVKIPANEDLTYTWTTPANDLGASGHEHTKKTYFNFTFFADPTSTSPAQFFCFPDRDGHQTIPAAVINALPAKGLIVHANFSHYMEARETMSGEQRRFDLVSTYSNISQYAKQ